MKNTFKKGLSLGLGLAVTTEQAEKIIDELVEKGELSKQEPKDFFNELIEKGQKTQKEIDETINKKVRKILADMHVASKEEVDELRERVEQLENQLEKQS